MEALYQTPERRAYAKILDDFWAATNYYKSVAGFSDPYIPAFSEALIAMRGEELEDFIVEGIHQHNTGPLHDKPLSGDDAYNLLLRFTNRYAQQFRSEKINSLEEARRLGLDIDYTVAKREIQKLRYPSDTYLDPSGYVNLLQWMITDERDILIYGDFRTLSVATSIPARYSDVGWILYSERERLGDNYTIYDIGSSDMSGLLHLAEGRPFKRVNFRRSFKAKEVDQEISDVLNYAANQPLTFAKALGIDRKDPLDSANLPHIQNCRRPGEIVRDGYVTKEEHGERLERQPRLLKYLGALTTKGIDNYSPTDQPDIVDGQAAVILCKTSAEYFPKLLKQNLKIVFERLSSENALVILSDFVSENNGNFRFYNKKSGEYKYATYVLGLDGKISDQPRQVAVYKDGRCENAVLGKDFGKLAIAKELSLAA